MDDHIRELERKVASGDTSAIAQLERARERAGIFTMRIVIDGETLEVNEIHDIGFGDLHELYTDDGDYIVSVDSETAGAAARERWQDMAENDPREFTAIVGEHTLVSWALGHSAGPGSAQVRSLDEWLDVVAEHPDEEWASYDGEEREIEEVSPDIVEVLGYTPTVAYRHN